MEKVVVTGSTGFIGNKLCIEFEKRGFKVIKMHHNFFHVENCDRIYHLACPSTTEKINENPIKIMDIIFDKTRQAIDICKSALFINASTYGVNFIDDSKQSCYNIAKLSMEYYLKYSGVKYLNYRLPSVFGEGMHDDNFIKRCIDNRAYKPKNPDQKYFISHIDDVVDSLINLTDLKIEETTLGNIYEQFNSRRRGLHRTTSNT
jgi:nucleoside-diphosphate-sugar epimerase